MFSVEKLVFRQPFISGGAPPAVGRRAERLSVSGLGSLLVDQLLDDDRVGPAAGFAHNLADQGF